MRTFIDEDHIKTPKYNDVVSWQAREESIDFNKTIKIKGAQFAKSINLISEIKDRVNTLVLKKQNSSSNERKDIIAGIITMLE